MKLVYDNNLSGFQIYKPYTRGSDAVDYAFDPARLASGILPDCTSHGLDQRGLPDHRDHHVHQAPRDGRTGDGNLRCTRLDREPGHVGDVLHRH